MFSTLGEDYAKPLLMRTLRNLLSFQHAEGYKQEEKCAETGSGTLKQVKDSHNLQNNTANKPEHFLTSDWPCMRVHECACVSHTDSHLFINDSLCISSQNSTSVIQMLVRPSAMRKGSWMSCRSLNMSFFASSLGQKYASYGVSSCRLVINVLSVQYYRAAFAALTTHSAQNTQKSGISDYNCKVFQRESSLFALSSSRLLVIDPGQVHWIPKSRTHSFF